MFNLKLLRLINDLVVCNDLFEPRNDSALLLSNTLCTIIMHSLLMTFAICENQYLIKLTLNPGMEKPKMLWCSGLTFGDMTISSASIFTKLLRVR